MNSKKSTNIFLSILLASILIAVLVYSNKYLAINNSPTINSQQSSQNSVALPAVECNFTEQLCLSTNQEFSANLTIEQSEIAAFIPLAFKLTFSGYNPDEVNIDFQGIEMFMGANKIQLEKQTDNSFKGIITLAGHHGSSMTWRAVTTYTTDNKSAEVWFEFPLD